MTQAPIIKIGNDIPIVFTIYEDGIVKDMSSCTILSWGIGTESCNKNSKMYVELMGGTNPYNIVVRNTFGSTLGKYWVRIDFEDNGERRSIDGFAFVLAEHSMPLAVSPDNPIQVSATTNISRTIDGVVRYDIIQELTTEGQNRARNNINAGTSNFSGDYNDLTGKPTIYTQEQTDALLNNKLNVDAPVVSETVIKATVSSPADMLSVQKKLTLLSTVEEAQQFFTNIALGYKPVLELYMDNVLYSRTPLFLWTGSYCCIVSPYGQTIEVDEDETFGAYVESINISALHSTTINVDISAGGTPTFNAYPFGFNGTEIINQYFLAESYGAFSPTLRIGSASTKYHSTLVPLYDAYFNYSDGSLTLRFALLNYDNYSIDMLQLVALSTGEITVSFVNWVANNASQVVTMAGGNGVYQTQEEFNQMVLGLDGLLSYGVEIDSAVSSPILTRIGNINLHRSLPIQNKMRGCLLDDNGNVIEYLPTNDWTTATRDGSRGQVMVEIPNFYFKCTTEGTKSKISISEYPLAGYIQFFNSSIKNVYCSAYEASLQRSTLKLSSVVNTTTDYRGGSNNNAWDGTYRSVLGMPATNVSLTNFRNYARNRNENATSQWNEYVYTIHVMLSWLFYIEYANLNSQATYKPQLDVNGYRQGGLGDGVTTLDGTKWTNFNGYYPFVPCGYTDSLGNKTGVVPFTMPFEYDSNGSANYIGEYNAATAYVAGNYVSSGTSLYVCILASTGNAVTNTTYFTPVTRTTVNVPSYRGIENPFGHLMKLTDGCKCMIQSDASGGISEFYVCDTPANFTSSGTTNYQLRGNLPRTTGYVKEVILGEYGEIMPLSVGGGSTTYFCDYFATSKPASGIDERGIMFSGNATYDAKAGFAFANTEIMAATASTSIGSRLCFIP